MRNAPHANRTWGQRQWASKVKKDHEGLIRILGVAMDLGGVLASANYRIKPPFDVLRGAPALHRGEERLTNDGRLKSHSANIKPKFRSKSLVPTGQNRTNSWPICTLENDQCSPEGVLLHLARLGH